ncbi:MAG TPA: class II fructose-bisphosphate aldolase [bacterium]|nr:class II fructose-bisphosphate aldolase [Dictyoglomota bacterium]HOK29238.1 class II fructose-bisphosphate aldolase [bacterium]HOP55798.1 class II fructose-bisphosphate aldolase [bacterium]HPO81606.1 class II fructose-bisphosphate aldolase [bacterium]HRU33147.1 class II fructose-bisphosphate aldolase [bacterium]
MLVTTDILFKEAVNSDYAIGAFNISNREFLVAIILAAKESNSPLIIQVSESTVKFLGFDYISHLIEYADKFSENIPIVVHLDHSRRLETIVGAIRAGFTSIMYDGSHLPFEENVESTREIVKISKAVGIPVEGEIGKIGGVEEHIKVKEDEVIYTSVEEAVRFYELTGVTSLAVAIGTAHGMQKKNARINFQRLEEIHSKLPDVPLVLHGSSGVPKEDLKTAIRFGIKKVNIATELKMAMADGIKRILDGGAIEPRDYLNEGIENVKREVLNNIEILGSADRV